MSQKIVYSDEEDIKPKKQRKPLSDEQKNALRERLAKAREAKKNKREQLKAPPPTPEPVEEEQVVEEEEQVVEEEQAVKEPLTKPAKRSYKKKDVKIELDPVETEEKPKRKYIRKPKITIPNPF